MDIRDIFTPGRAALAPLAGVTDSAFRRLCVEFGARPVMTEMVSADGFVRGPRKKSPTLRLLRYHESERPVGIQFFGSDPDIMAAAAGQAQALGPDFIDINAGCPVRKVVGRGAGSALMQRPEHLGTIVARMVAVSNVPVTVKIRSGWDHDSINAVTVAEICADAGAAAVIVHPRTRSQKYAGEADWDIIRAVAEAVSVPVIGSGDITGPDAAADMLARTGAHAVMIGRRAMGDPWIFAQVRARLAGEPIPPSPTAAEKLELGIRHLELLAAEVGPRFAVLNMRKGFGWYSRGARGGAEFRRRLFRAETVADAIAVVRAFQEECAGDDGTHDAVAGTWWDMAS